MLFYNANNLANKWKITDGSVLTTDDPINERISRRTFVFAASKKFSGTPAFFAIFRRSSFSSSAFRFFSCSKTINKLKSAKVYKIPEWVFINVGCFVSKIPITKKTSFVN